MKIPYGLLCAALSFAGMISAQEPQPPKTSQRAGHEVFSRLRNGLDPESCNTATLNRWLKDYIHDHKQFERQLSALLPAIDHVSDQIQKRGLPMEYALIPFVESRFQAKAIGKGGPVGLWQLMPETARHYGLHIGGSHDERLSIIRSTEAALSYLQKLQNSFGDWQTGILAYNAGDSRVRNRLKHQGLKRANARQGLPSGLPARSYVYVQKIQTLSCFMRNPERFNIHFPEDVLFTPLKSGTAMAPQTPDR